MAEVIINISAWGSLGNRDQYFCTFLGIRQEIICAIMKIFLMIITKWNGAGGRDHGPELCLTSGQEASCYSYDH